MTTDELLGARIRLADDVLKREVGDELILLDLKTEAYFGLNPSARAFIDRVTAGVSAGEAADAVATEHEAEPAAVREDMAALLRELLDAGLVDVVSE
jgi:hypothetical protein